LEEQNPVANDQVDRRRGSASAPPQGEETSSPLVRRAVISVVLLAVLGGGVYWGVGKAQEFFGAPDYEGNPAKVSVSVTIDQGDIAAVIGQKLYDKKVVKSVKAYTNAATANPKGNDVQPGTYQLFEEMPASIACRCSGPGQEHGHQPGPHSRGQDGHRHI